jgi:hypothetical protein
MLGPRAAHIDLARAVGNAYDFRMSEPKEPLIDPEGVTSGHRIRASAADGLAIPKWSAFQLVRVTSWIDQRPEYFAEYFSMTPASTAASMGLAM